MARRYLVIWFRHLMTDWVVRRQPQLKDKAFVLATPQRGRMTVTAASGKAVAMGIFPQMVVADCRAIFPGLTVLDDKPCQAEKILSALAEWCIRYTPAAGISLPDDLILDISGCAHLWGGEQAYMEDIITRLKDFGYHVHAAIADTIGTAWAVAHYSSNASIIVPGKQAEVLLPLPTAALRPEAGIAQRLDKLGLYTIGSFMIMPRPALRRRFGQHLLSRIDQALGQEIEILQPVKPIEPYQERLPSLEPIRTAVGIEIALKQLLEKLCDRFSKEYKGLRRCYFKCYRIDGNLQQVEIGTNRPSRNVTHLFKLFENKITQVAPDLGIELFVLEAPVIEDLSGEQEALWNTTGSEDNIAVAELLDKIACKTGMQTIHRYLPEESYWPERSIKLAASLAEKPTTAWRTDLPRPVHLLPKPEPIEVTVQMPDYPPMLFRYKGTLHYISKADGPERIEQEWWIQNGQYRDYYCVEDKNGGRYWLFRSGHYNNSNPKWYIHGFFA